MLFICDTANKIFLNNQNDIVSKSENVQRRQHRSISSSENATNILNQINASTDILEFIDSDCSNFLSNLGLMITSCNDLFPDVSFKNIDYDFFKSLFPFISFEINHDIMYL